VNDELFRSSAGLYPPLTWLDGKISDSVASATSSPILYPGVRSLNPTTHAATQLQMNYTSQFSLSLHSLILRLPSVLRCNWLIGDAGRGKTIDWKDTERQLETDDEEYSDYDDCSTKSISSCCKRSNQSSVVDDYGIGVEALQDFLDCCASYDGGERMDYVITQTDISRMARCASKHLDVASILSLPTITYRSPPPKMVTIKTEETTLPFTKEFDSRVSAAALSGMWSWMMISRDGQAAVLSEQWDTQDEVYERHDQDCCVICLENFSDGEKLRVLPCSHYFHTGCIDHWLLGTYSDYECVTSGCPMCKKKATTIAEEVISASGSVPSWAFKRLGGALAKESIHQNNGQTVISQKEDESLPSSVSSSV